MKQFLAADHVVVMQEGRSQEIAERRMAEMGLDRHIVLRSPHFMSVPHLVATSDIISIVPRAVGRAFLHTGRLKLLEPPFKIPSIELKQLWHRRVHTDPGVLWLRTLIARLYLNRDPSETDDSPDLRRQPSPAPASKKLSQHIHREDGIDVTVTVFGSSPEIDRNWLRWVAVVELHPPISHRTHMTWP